MLVPALIGLTAGEALRMIFDKRQALWIANTLAKDTGKPTINIGAGCGRLGSESSWGELKCDIKPSGQCFYCDAQDLSQFPDKTFSVAFLSHVLEHLHDPERGLKEAQRIADNVVVVLPRVSSLWTWLWPEHKQIPVGGTTMVRANPALTITLVGLTVLFIGGYVATRRRK